MTFHDIQGQPRVKQQLQHALRRGTVAHAYLFGGPPGTGKKAMALALAKALFCEVQGEDACNSCLACRKFESGNQPALHVVVPEGASIKIDQMRGLQRSLGYRSVEQARTVYIVEQAEKMTIQAANSLLKFLEEPQTPVVALLLTDNPQALLPTIRSRAQLLTFYPLPARLLLQQLLAEGHPPELARVAAHLASGLDACRAYIQQEGFAEARNLVIQLGKESIGRYSVAMVTAQQRLFKTQLADKAELIMDMLLLWFKDLIHVQAGRPADLIYQDQLEWMRQQAYARTSAGWVKGMELALAARKRMQAHVSPQLALEQFLVNLQEG